MASPGFPGQKETTFFRVTGIEQGIILRRQFDRTAKADRVNQFQRWLLDFEGVLR
jgi:hypothetical protein